MSARAYFQSLSSTVIIISIIIGLSAIFLLERIVPAIDDILQENVYSVSAAVGMLSVISSSRSGGEDDQSREKFWEFFDKAKANITLQEEDLTISEISTLAKRYWNGEASVEDRENLTEQINKLAEINLKAMEAKDQAAQLMGLTGAWSLGFLLLISVGIQFLLRVKILSVLITPIEQILSVLSDFHSGNRMRRFVESKGVVEDVGKIGTLVNSNLDQITIEKDVPTSTSY